MLFETLETRNLFSVCAVHSEPAPSTPVPDLAVVADEKQVDAALLLIAKDDCTFSRTLCADWKALFKDGLTGDTTLAPLFQQLQADSSSMENDLKADRQAEATVVAADQSAIRTDEMQICKDKHNPTALAADQAALLAGRIQLQNDEIFANDASLTSLQTDENTIAGDLGAIVGALAGDTTASPKLSADVTKFRNDKFTAMNGMASDLLGLITARANLVGDLMALQT
jgi:hypothetical protein